MFITFKFYIPLSIELRILRSAVYEELRKLFCLYLPVYILIKKLDTCYISDLYISDIIYYQTVFVLVLL